eukprot:4908910-Prymnesium_polylepis.1
MDSVQCKHLPSLRSEEGPCPIDVLHRDCTFCRTNGLDLLACISQEAIEAAWAARTNDRLSTLLVAPLLLAAVTATRATTGRVALG